MALSRNLDGSVTVAATARFSLLSDTLVRMEYSPSGTFEDRVSVRAMSRPVPVMFAEVKEEAGTVTLRGARIVVTFRPDNLPFHAGNLEVCDASGKRVWRPGMVDTTNLGGVHWAMDWVGRGLTPAGVHEATMDHYPNTSEWDLWSSYARLREAGTGDLTEDELRRNPDELVASIPPHRLSAPLRDLLYHRSKYPPGPLSRAGYFVYNDTPTPIVNPSDGWVVERPGEAGYQDLYLFCYGHDYAAALRDVRRLFGASPLLPRYSLGLWFSRFPTFKDAELRDIITEFERHDLPLDVMVLDMEWHQRGWHGWDWSPTHFDNPDGFLAFMRSKNLHATLNVHPQVVPVEDSRFERFVKEAGITVIDEDCQPKEPGQAAVFGNFDASIPSHARAFLEVLHKPVEDQGIDFWWIDGAMPVRSIAGLDDQLWTNHLYQRHMQRFHPDRRPMVFSRTPGLGAHRYAFHFTGDTKSSWETLANQVEQTLRAGHMGQSFVTHDIGGHMSEFEFIDPELYVRWAHFGVLSPIVRFHSSKIADGIGGERRPWIYGEKVLEAVRRTLRLRMELLPYLYTLAWESTQTCLPLCRSNALQNPSWEEGYGEWTSYYLGDRIYAAPVVTPGTFRNVLLPPGRWYNALTGVWIDSDGVRPHFCISHWSQPPLHFVRAGSLLVRQPFADRASRIPDKLIIEVYPAGKPCTDEFVLYEDDGMTQAHESGAFGLTCFTMEETSGEVKVTIGPMKGTFQGCPATCDYEVRVIGGTHNGPDAAPTSRTLVSVLPTQEHEVRLSGWQGFAF